MDVKLEKHGTWNLKLADYNGFKLELGTWDLKLPIPK